MSNSGTQSGYRSGALGATGRQERLPGVLSFAKQEGHPNAVHARDAEAEDHPLPRKWVAGLMETAKANGGSIDWINCGLCVDERGVGEWIDGCRRGGPKHLIEASAASDGTLIIGARG